MSKFISLSAGHGGTDSGAIGNGYKERDLTMELVNLIEKYLKAKYTGFTIETMQEKTSNGVFRSSTAYGTQSGFYMSIHFNSNAGTAGNGTEILQGNYGSSRCNNINKVLAKYFYNRGVKQIDTSQFYMLRECGFDMIAEVCFINNSSDMKKYQENKNKIAEELADAIAKSEGLEKKTTKKSSDTYYFKYTPFNWSQTVTNGESKDTASGMLECTKDTFLYHDKECTRRRQDIPKGHKFATCGNDGGYNKKGYYTHTIITDSGKWFVCYKRK